MNDNFNIQAIGLDTGNRLLDKSICLYLLYGINPGSFTTAILKNDLYLAATKADHWNSQNLPHIVKNIWKTLPPISYGDSKRVRDWKNDVDGRRTKYQQHIFEKHVMLKLES